MAQKGDVVILEINHSCQITDRLMMLDVSLDQEIKRIQKTHSEIPDAILYYLIKATYQGFLDNGVGEKIALRQSLQAIDDFINLPAEDAAELIEQSYSKLNAMRMREEARKETGNHYDQKSVDFSHSVV